MSARRITAGLLVVLMLLSCMSGCKKNDKKGNKREKSPQEQTEALMDDFCAYIKGGKFDKLDKLVDGPCVGIDQLKAYAKSEVSGILDSSLKELSFKIDSVEEEGDGTVAKLTVTYFDTSAVLDQAGAFKAPKDAVTCIENEPKSDHTYTFHAFKNEQWQISAVDAETFLQALFGYIGELPFSTEETVPGASKTFKPFSVYETHWYDEKYNVIPGIHETEDEIRYYVVTWDYYNKVEVRYEFTDNDGTVVGEGKIEMLGNTDIIDVALNPAKKLPAGELWCRLYDPTGKCFSETMIEVFPDGVRIPIPFEFSQFYMLDEAGQKVKEYPFGTEYIAAKLASDIPYKDIRIDYKVFSEEEYKKQGTPAFEGSLLPPDGQEDKEYTLPVTPDDAKVLPEGNYYFVVYDMRGGEFWKTDFVIVPSELSETTVESGSETTLDPNAKYDLTGMVICIDPGHQGKANNDTEPLAPWSDEQKAKVSAGTSGVATKRPEHEVNLEIGLKLKAYLESMGATVVMTRETADVDISNVERAKMAVECKADVFLRLHCDAADSPDTRGVGVFVCSKGELAEKQVGWGDMLGECYAAATGAKYRGCNASTTYSGLNWATSVPSFLLEMGYMSNEEDDRLLSDPEYQDKICDGIADFCYKMKKEGA